MKTEEQCAICSGLGALNPGQGDGMVTCDWCDGTGYGNRMSFSYRRVIRRHINATLSSIEGEEQREDYLRSIQGIDA